MGMFDNGSKTYWSSTSTRLYKDVDGVVKQTALNAVTQNRNIARDLMDNLVNGVYFGANQLYNYAKSGGYPYGLPEGSAYTLAADNTARVKIVIQREVNNPIYLTYCFIERNPLSEMIYTAGYQLLDINGNMTGELIVWTYNASTGTHPLLGITVDDVSPYYPVIPVRIDNVNQVAEGMPNRKEIIKAGKFLSLDIEELNENIESQLEEDDNNPPENVFVVLGVEIADETQVAKEYLHRFFTHQIGVAQVEKEHYDHWDIFDRELERTGQQDQERYTTPPYNSIVISEDQYHMSLDFLYITTSIVTGSIGKKGTFQVSYTPIGDKYVGNPTYAQDGTIIQAYATTKYNADILVIQKQIASNQYEEIQVHGLVHSSWALGHEIRTTLDSAFTDPEVAPCFIVPLRKDLTVKMGAVKLHDLMYSAIRMIVNDEYRVKLKWYQSGWFQIVVLIVAIVASAVTFNPVTGALIITAASVGLALVQVMIMIVLKPILLKALEDIVGEEVALLVQAIAAYYMGGGGASGLGSAGLTAVSSGVNVYYQSELEDLTKDLESANKDLELMEEEESVLASRMAAVASSISGDPYAILQSDNFVKRFFMEPKMPLLIRETTDRFVDISQFTDKPESYIRLGHQGATHV